MPFFQGEKYDAVYREQDGKEKEREVFYHFQCIKNRHARSSSTVVPTGYEAG